MRHYQLSETEMMAPYARETHNFQGVDMTVNSGLEDVRSRSCSQVLEEFNVRLLAMRRWKWMQSWPVGVR